MTARRTFLFGTVTLAMAAVFSGPATAQGTIKIGAGSRAAASLFAVQHGLLPEEELIAGGT